MADENNNLPSSIQGDGRKFISLLKNSLGDIKETIDEQYKYITGIFNANADNPDTIAEQVYSLSVDEKRVSGSITLTLKWNSDDVRNYAGVLIEVKEKNTPDPVNWDDIEYTRRYATAKTNTFTIENCSIGYQYYIRVRARDIVNALSVASAAPVITHYVSPMDHTPRPPYEFTVVFDKRGAYWSWKQYDQNEYQLTELRLDTYVGEVHNRLDLTTDLYSTAIPTARVGTAYLYNKGIGNAYSAPVKLDFALGVPPAPMNVKLTQEFGGLHITFDAIPDSCMGANIYVNNEKHYVDTNEYLFLATMGTFTVKVAYVDALGEGALSQPQTINIVTYINKEWIRDGEITREKINSSVNKVMDDSVAAIEQLNTDVTNINQDIDALTNDLVTKHEANVVSINKTNTDLTALATRVTATENTNTTQATLIKQNADSITSTATSLTKLINANQDATNATLAQHSTSIKQNADSITSTATSLTKKINDNKATTDTAISGVASSVTQEAGRIDTIITNLGKAPSETGYSAFTQTVNSINSVVKSVGDLKTATQSSITQLNDAIGLRVKKGETISDINLSPEGVYINGNHIVINGDTVINGKIIQGKHMADGTIQTLQIADGAISADKLAANSVTAGKISTNAVTAGTIAAGAVTTETMDVNSINGDRIIANTLDASKIKANTITASQIASNTITADNLLSDNIEMTGNLQVSGGGVTLSERGLSLRQNNGSSTLYNTDGINYYDSSGNIYAQTTKTMIGVAKDGQYVKFKTPWETNPNVIIIPTTFRTNDKNYTSSNTKIICNASEISKNGFRVNNYLQLDEGSTNYSPINKSFTPSALTGVHYFNQVGYGDYTYHISMGLYQDFVVTNIPSTANSLVIGYSTTAPDGNYAGLRLGYDHANSGYTGVSNLYWQVWFNINGAGAVVKMYPTSNGQVSLPVSGGGNLMARLEIYGTISINEHGVFSTINNFEAQNKIFTNLAQGIIDGRNNKTVPNLVVPWVQYTAATSKIDGGDATFLVTDGGSSLYTVS